MIDLLLKFSWDTVSRISDAPLKLEKVKMVENPNRTIGTPLSVWLWSGIFGNWEALPTLSQSGSKSILKECCHFWSKLLSWDHFSTLLALAWRWIFWLVKQPDDPDFSIMEFYVRSWAKMFMRKVWKLLLRYSIDRDFISNLTILMRLHLFGWSQKLFSNIKAITLLLLFLFLLFLPYKMLLHNLFNPF
jgi:hypothetical protein